MCPPSAPPSFVGGNRVGHGAEVGPDWSRRPVAQLRHTGAGFWLLLSQNWRGRWERYLRAPDATRDLDALLAELEHDGLCLFWT
ncbi:MAG: DUF3024 domain-containing protein [Acidimicrobiales bacterium]